MTTYLIEKDIVEFAAIENKALIILISQIMVATMQALDVRGEELTSPKKHRGRKASEARHVFMLMLYNSTPKSKISRQVISELLGYTSTVAQNKAKYKMQSSFLFRKKYNLVKKTYEKMNAAEYDKAIPF